MSRSRVRVVRVVALVSLTLVSARADAASVIVNGSFEVGTNPGSFTELPVGSTAISGWTVIGNPIDYVGTLWMAADGTRSIDLNGTSTPTPGGISQTFATTLGASYIVSFDMAGNPQGAPTIKTLQVAAAGQSADFSFDITGTTFSNMGWLPKEWQFTATGTSTTLAFSSLTANTPFGPTLDNVIVQEVVATVPEPPGFLLLAVGIVGLGGLAIKGR